MALLSTSLLLCGCSPSQDSRIEALDKKISLLQAQLANITNKIPKGEIQTNNLPDQQIAGLKLWMLDKLETLELTEITNHDVIQSNMMQFTVKAVQIAIESK